MHQSPHRLSDRRHVEPDAARLIVPEQLSQKQHSQVRVAAAQLLHELVSPHMRQAHVRDDNVERPQASGEVQRFSAVRGYGCHVAIFAEGALDKRADQELIIDNEHVRALSGVLATTLDRRG